MQTLVKATLQLPRTATAYYAPEDACLVACFAATYSDRVALGLDLHAGGKGGPSQEAAGSLGLPVAMTFATYYKHAALAGVNK